MFTIASESSNTKSPERELTKQTHAQMPTRRAAAGYGNSEKEIGWYLVHSSGIRKDKHLHIVKFT